MYLNMRYQGTETSIMVLKPADGDCLFVGKDEGELSQMDLLELVLEVTVGRFEDHDRGRTTWRTTAYFELPTCLSEVGGAYGKYSLDYPLGLLVSCFLEINGDLQQ
jgi:hypothetical protein